MGLGKGFITPDTKSVTINFEPGSKYYSEKNNKMYIPDDATLQELTMTHDHKYNSEDLLAGTTDLYVAGPKDTYNITEEHDYYTKDY